MRTCWPLGVVLRADCDVMGQGEALPVCFLSVIWLKVLTKSKRQVHPGAFVRGDAGNGMAPVLGMFVRKCFILMLPGTCTVLASDNKCENV